jgi:hypothetical protein
MRHHVNKEARTAAMLDAMRESEGLDLAAAIDAAAEAAEALQLACAKAAEIARSIQQDSQRIIAELDAQSDRLTTLAEFAPRVHRPGRIFS